MRAVLIHRRLKVAFMRQAVKPRLHAPDVFSRVPQRVVIRAYHQELTAYALHLDRFVLGDRVRRLGIVEYFA